MKEIRPTDYEINDISFEVDGEEGNNILNLTKSINAVDEEENKKGY